MTILLWSAAGYAIAALYAIGVTIACHILSRRGGAFHTCHLEVPDTHRCQGCVSDRAHIRSAIFWPLDGACFLVMFPARVVQSFLMRPAARIAPSVPPPCPPEDGPPLRNT